MDLVDDPVLPDPDASSPLVTLTSATVPLMGERRVAAASAAFASLTAPRAEVTAVASAVSWAVVELLLSSSVVSVAFALASWACAWATVFFSPTVAMVPSTWPLLTLSPCATRTEVISAAVPKLTSSLSAGVSVPVVDTDWRTVPVATLTSRVVAWALAGVPLDPPVQT